LYKRSSENVHGAELKKVIFEKPLETVQNEDLQAPELKLD
jgi:hypothetical protein